MNGVDATITVDASAPVIAIRKAAPTKNIHDFVQTLRSTAVLNTAQLVASPDVPLPQRDPDRILEVLQPTHAGPRKDTVLVAPMQTVEFDFDANNPGRWITHCHNDYHLDSGMATNIYYTDRPPADPRAKGLRDVAIRGDRNVKSRRVKRRRQPQGKSRPQRARRYRQARLIRLIYRCSLRCP